MWRVFNHGLAAYRPTLDIERGLRPGIRQYHRGDSASHHESVGSLPHGAMVILPEEGTRPIIVGEARLAIIKRGPSIWYSASFALINTAAPIDCIIRHAILTFEIPIVENVTRQYERESN